MIVRRIALTLLGLCASAAVIQLPGCASPRAHAPHDDLKCPAAQLYVGEFEVHMSYLGAVLGLEPAAWVHVSGPDSSHPIREIWLINTNEFEFPGQYSGLVGLHVEQTRVEPRCECDWIDYVYNVGVDPDDVGALVRRDHTIAHCCRRHVHSREHCGREEVQSDQCNHGGAAR